MSAHGAVQQPAKSKEPMNKKAGKELVAIEPCNSYNPEKIYHSLQMALLGHKL